MMETFEDAVLPHGYRAELSFDNVTETMFGHGLWEAVHRGLDG